MRTETVNIYKFNELSETAKEKAIEEYRQRNSFFDQDFIIDDCCDIAEKFGLDIRFC